MSTDSAPGRSGSRSIIPILIAVLFLVAGGWAAKAFLIPAPPKTILLMGVDEGKTRTDVLLVAHINPGRNLVNLISIPRDTLVNIPCDGVKHCVTPDKVAHAHVYGGDRGPDLTIGAVENLLGVEIDHYVKVDYEGFARAIDLLGGVEIVIDRAMDYEDPYARPPLKIHFKASPNPQYLDGNQALNYVRFRADDLGDIGRISRTKKFFFALAQSVRKNGTISKLPSLVSSVWPYISTDMDMASAVALARLAPKVDVDRIAAEVIPGRDDPDSPRGWVWRADKEKTADQVDRLIRNPQRAEAPSK